MSSLLIEVLFVDNPGDLALLRNSAFINDVSRGIAEGVADARFAENDKPTVSTGGGHIIPCHRRIVPKPSECPTTD
ncbi:N-acetylmuramoyl-L-alanine amidase [Halobacillus litoralis]|nr:N-acetylmuramoyl-L-alanine amidase [Halobacillus litoralis]WLR46582.1 N-acetylmuramoyl-L-alanine amidase [Halobacillus litoralis]